MSNRNTYWAGIFVDELARAGLKHVCIAPGSRSTPLTLAFAAHEAITVHSHLDERSAAFYALGIGLADDFPAALVCTSGTASAEFYPAIIEAYMSHVPLLVLTADRPPELRHSGANQTIDQIKMYGDNVLWAVDVALPEANPPAEAVRNLRALAGRAISQATGIRSGPVHLNFPFRKPLEPTPIHTDTQSEAIAAARPDHTPFVRAGRGIVTADEATLGEITALIDGTPNGWIICGPRRPDDAFAAAVLKLGEKAGYPVLADPVSGVRFAGSSAGGPLVSSYDTMLLPGMTDIAPPDIVIRFGAVPTSKTLNTYLDANPPAHLIQVSGSGVWADDSHRTSVFIHADETHLCRALTDALRERGENATSDALTALDAAVWDALDATLDEAPFFDGRMLRDVAALISAESALFIGNSLPIRHFDQFGKPGNNRLQAFANRGASGIDGNISTALGIGAVRPDSHLVAIMGDITFYHDMNGLLAIARCGVPVTIILLNNDGGGIFHRLPVRDYDPAFTDLFITPHGMNFEHAAALYNLDYLSVTGSDSFREAFSQRMKQSPEDMKSSIIEVRTGARHDLDCRREVIASVQRRLAEFRRA